MISTSYRQECLCGRSFDNTGAFTRHNKTCLKGKKRLANVLNQAQESYYHRKRCRVKESPSSSQTASLEVVSRTVDEALDDTPSDTLPSVVDGVQCGTALMSGLNEVCNPFFFVVSDLIYPRRRCKQRMIHCRFLSAGPDELTVDF